MTAFLLSINNSVTYIHWLYNMETYEQIDAHQTQSSSSSSSSIDSNNYSSSLCLSSVYRNSSSSRNRTDLSTDLKLGLSISPSSQSQLPRYPLIFFFLCTFVTYFWLIVILTSLMLCLGRKHVIGHQLISPYWEAPWLRNKDLLYLLKFIWKESQLVEN